MVNSLNEVCEKNGYLVPVIVAGVFFTLLFATQAPNPIPAIVVGLIMVVASWGAGRADTSRKNVVFAYELEDESEKNYKHLIAALDRLGACDGLWYVDASGDINNLTAWKRNAGASHLISKHKTQLSYDAPPGLKSNITPPCLKVEDKYLYFMPDFLLVREGSRYGSVGYHDLRLATRPSRFIVEDTVPRDCVVVGSTWKHPNKNGGPDRRFANNRELPICLFEELGIVSGSGLKALILASVRDAVTGTEKALRRIVSTSTESKQQDDHTFLLEG